MALLNEVKNCLIKNGLEGFIRVAEAPPHEEQDKVAMTIVVGKLSEGMVQGAIELPSGGLHSIENPSTQTLTKYFEDFSIASTANRTEGTDNPLFREVTRLLLAYGFVHHRLLTMPKK